MSPDEALARLGIDAADAAEAVTLAPVRQVLAGLDEIRSRHREFGIPDDISWRTLSHLGRAYRSAHGEKGFELSRWDWLRYSGGLYEVGRLEVTPYLIRTEPKEAGPLFWYDDAEAAKLGPGWRRGDPALGLHVPAGGELAPADCDAALARLRPAFAGRYPGMPLRIATCTAWLLDGQLAEYLPADSNIVSFQRRFQLAPGAKEHDEGVMRLVAGSGTALECAVAEHLRNGRHWYMRTGWLELPR